MTKQNLTQQIKKANSADQLQQIIDSMPKQENGFPTKLARLLQNVFWYSDITSLETQKEWMLERVLASPNN
jgi:pyruvate/oxaloacetate carboxyltransferase